MLCDICHTREAVIFYTVVINNQKTELHLCEECAAKKGLIKPPNLMNLKEILSLVPTDPGIDKLKCPGCGLTYKEFKEVTKFGCADCYEAFEEKLIPLLRRLHGKVEHTGKAVCVASQRDKRELKIFELEKGLKRAIEDECYEEAARIRDELNKIRNATGH